jgi:hypothetical protein
MWTLPIFFVALFKTFDPIAIIPRRTDLQGVRFKLKQLKHSRTCEPIEESH